MKGMMYPMGSGVDKPKEATGGLKPSKGQTMGPHGPSGSMTKDATFKVEKVSGDAIKSWMMRKG